MNSSKHVDAYVICGVPGSGKTTVSQRLVDYFNLKTPTGDYVDRYNFSPLLDEIKETEAGLSNRWVFYLNRDKIRVNLIKLYKTRGILPPTDEDVSGEMYRQLEKLFEPLKSSNGAYLTNGMIVIDGCFTNEKDLRKLNNFLYSKCQHVMNCFVNTSIVDFFTCKFKSRYFLNNCNEQDYGDYDLLNEGTHLTVPKTVFERKAKELTQKVQSLLSLECEENLYIPTYLFAPNGFVRLSNKMLPSSDAKVQKILREQAQMKIEYPNAFY
jgi:hypothetical protein